MRNPKSTAAREAGRVRLDLLEPVADEETAIALADGADKYGIRNYTEVQISARDYVAAMRRHIAAWLDGENKDPASGAHPLGHVAACVHVVLAAEAAGMLVDDLGRSPQNNTPAELPFSESDTDGYINRVIGRRIQRERFVLDPGAQGP